MTLLVTGGAGFIGSAVVRKAIAQGRKVINLDALTYAACLDNLASVQDNPLYIFKKSDIRDAATLRSIFAEYRPSAVMHLAAESHVDRSILAPANFIETNIIGTYNLLQTSLHYWRQNGEPNAFRFHHVSTDEVYGSLSMDDTPFREDTAYAPNSPYSASKAASDHLVRAWGKTYNLPVVTSNCSNNYGPFQFPEKLIPVVIIAAIEGKPIPVYGAGENIRDWLYVEDHADALLTILNHGKLGKNYNVGGLAELRNIDLVHQICAILDDLRPNVAPYSNQISFVTDRPGHDLRYAIDTSCIEKELGWTPKTNLQEGLQKTVQWVLDNENWWRSKLLA